MAALFDGSDERGMRVYRKLLPNSEGLPKNGAVVVACALGRLEKAAFAVGYKRSRGQWGAHAAGCIAPVLLGRGEALVEGIDWRALGYRCVEIVAGEKATHVTIAKQG